MCRCGREWCQKKLRVLDKKRYLATCFQVLPNHGAARASKRVSRSAKELLSPQNKDELCARDSCCEIMGLPTRIPLGERNPPTNSLFSLKRVWGNLTRPRGHGQRYDYFWTIRFGGTATSFTNVNLTSLQVWVGRLFLSSSAAEFDLWQLNSISAFRTD
ncbi:hypothetical protein TNIN_189271 [Trichonephila inaurata madagascariensis]|uniref:Uncharacterized protein n=1 Tax=Trichonephila inaurata madagascariensis TaxID=2747483 RepID=A0A8X6WQ81_9ARAC|nr:hypothetical protein TNIN_189271 [Trichonephila inaurata madagascariensis]